MEEFAFVFYISYFATCDVLRTEMFSLCSLMLIFCLLCFCLLHFFNVNPNAYNVPTTLLLLHMDSLHSKLRVKWTPFLAGSKKYVQTSSKMKMKIGSRRPFASETMPSRLVHVWILKLPSCQLYYFLAWPDRLLYLAHYVLIRPVCWNRKLLLLSVFSFSKKLMKQFFFEVPFLRVTRCLGVCVLFTELDSRRIRSWTAANRSWMMDRARWRAKANENALCRILARVFTEEQP